MATREQLWYVIERYQIIPSNRLAVPASRFFIAHFFPQNLLIMKYELQQQHCCIPADVLTPVSAYLKLRDLFPNSILLESSDYNGIAPSYSYICCQPIAGIVVQDSQVDEIYPKGNPAHKVYETKEVLEAVNRFIGKFVFQPAAKEFYKGRFFGHINFDAVQYFDKVAIRNTGATLPDIRFHVYRYVLVFDHINHTVYLTEHYLREEQPLGFNQLQSVLRNAHMAIFPFATVGQEQAHTSNDEFRELVKQGKNHCYAGDVFQLVLSQAFSQSYRGDDFQVYRALRMVNPSPYLFYFDYGNYRLFGSSPETQVKVQQGRTLIHPIAGTCPRSGDAQSDELLVAQLLADPKENSEHVMLVDLARNDLSKSHDEVRVTNYKQVQYCSHVAHIVSEVEGLKPLHADPLRMVAETFPAGTLSGAPKYKALELIHQYEVTNRSYYGGSIGYLSADGLLNQAIMIRTFMSKDNTLHYRAGAGIVASSVIENELQEVQHKLKALRTSVIMAQELGRSN